ncbi:MAG: oxidoreductase [Deltaproteobacteria bacterium]|nr:MAG: oxidoreductase [Deltaproteobacteria bacterium]
MTMPLSAPVEFETELIEVIQRSRHIKSFRFLLPRGVTYLPGQIFVLTITMGGKEWRKHFSLSSSPTEEGYFEFTKRITDSEFSRNLAEVKPGVKARVKMPFGEFTFRGEAEKIAFVTGGIGITAPRSIIRFIHDRKLPTHVSLIYSNRTAEDVAFLEELLELKKSWKNFQAFFTLTKEEKLPDWAGFKGRITADMVRRATPDFHERVFFVSGPPSLVDSLVGVITTELSIPENQVKAERYMGYR